MLSRKSVRRSGKTNKAQHSTTLHLTHSFPSVALPAGRAKDLEDIRQLRLLQGSRGYEQ